MFNLIGSHDTMRILTRFNGNKDLVKLAYLFIFSFCGSPAIYYGDEIGLEGRHDPDCRRCMIWDEKRQDQTMFGFFQKLIALRKAYDDFHLVDIKWLSTQSNVLVYQKGKLIFIINNNNDCVEIDLNRKVKDLETDQVMDVEKLAIKPYGYRIFEEITI
jgi:glycosidase